MESKRGRNYQDPKSWGIPEARTPQAGKSNETSTQSKIDLALEAIKICEQGVDRRNKPVTKEMKIILLRRRIAELKSLDSLAHDKDFILNNDTTIHQVLDQYRDILT